MQNIDLSLNILLPHRTQSFHKQNICYQVSMFELDTWVHSRHLFYGLSPHTVYNNEARECFNI